MFDPDQIHEHANMHGFKRRGAKNWVRRTADFVQLVNLQGSQWCADQNYLNFALWALALGEPATIAESKFHFRIRSERLGGDLATFFTVIDRDFETMDQLRVSSREYACFMSLKLRDLVSTAEA